MKRVGRTFFVNLKTDAQQESLPDVDPGRYLVFDIDRDCPLCGHGKKHVLSRKMQFALDCTTVICEACGFCFVSPPPLKEAYDRFYREAYSHYYRRIHQETGPASFEETAEDRARFDRIEQFRRIKGASVLEIGAGTGRFIGLMSRRGGDCSAVEPSREFREALARNGIRTVGDFLENVDATKRYSIICLFQVLEHFYHPRTAMRKIFGLLEDDGVVVLEVPNIWKPYRNLDRYFFRYVHLSYFSLRSLARLLQISGFRILDSDEGRDYIYRPSFLFVIARKDPSIGAALLQTDDHRELMEHLRRYRARYPYRDAPRIWALQLKRYARKVLSEGLIGSAYRGTRKMLAQK